MMAAVLIVMMVMVTVFIPTAMCGCAAVKERHCLLAAFHMFDVDMNGHIDQD